MMMKFRLIPAALILVIATSAKAQDPSPFDFGKMWTFENPPKEWFMDAYRFEAGDSWFDDVRKSSLRFATWCSASFVSPNGLIMTNHHCSRGVVGDLMREGEDFDKNGFYAQTQAEERKADGLFVEQLLMVDDITDQVKAYTTDAENDADRITKTQEALTEIQEKYAEMDDWKDLRLQVVTYYSGERHSLYGYKRFDDIRLVWIPELDLGFYGGDPDNFTYPRYNLDCTFWRAYGDDGQPLNTSSNYFKFNPGGSTEGEAVFVIGNPGSTERYRTVAQLEYDRDYRYAAQLEWMRNRHQMMEEEYAVNPSHDLQEQIFNFSNSIKAFTGIVDGLNNPELFARKVKMEEKIRANAANTDSWTRLEDHYEELAKHSDEINFLGANPMNGRTLGLVYAVDQLMSVLSPEAEGADLTELKEGLIEASAELNTDEERQRFAMLLGEMKMFQSPGETYVDDVLKGRSPEAAATEILEETVFGDTKALEKLLKKKPKKILKKKDPMMEIARAWVPRYHDAVRAFQSTGAERQALEAQVAREVFKVYGDALPPDATFTLRISDGKVQGYDYNGTEAPYKTTYFGLYDRHYSNDKNFPWSLPERWQNPPMDLLMAPVNFVSTNDIIGGNSGSPVINIKKEAVGLVFDGNIESLPGNFIFDEEFNRTVSVHSGGIHAALKYIYKADRIVDELAQ